MATFDYAALGARADTLLDRFGGAVTIQRQTSSGPDFDPVLGTTDYDAVAAVVDYTNREIDGSVVQVGDRRALVKAGGLEITPEPGDRVVRGGEIWRIERVDRIDIAGGGSILWDLQLRRA